MAEKNEFEVTDDAAPRAESDELQADADALALQTNDPVYDGKARVLNRAASTARKSTKFASPELTPVQIQDIGMGWYQWQLFIVIGFGWASDNLWPIVTSLIFTPITNEFTPTRPPLLTLAQNIGLLSGAMFWGFGCDVFGRRWAFNLTLGVTAVFGMIAASSPNLAAIGCFAALWSFGVGGNLPVDSAIFLEFLPGSHQYLLTVLSVDWALAQVVATLIAWPLLAHFTCQEGQKVCMRSENAGWRWFVFTMGGLTLIMWAVRFVFFSIYESPKYLMGKGNDERAVEVVHEVARRNSKSSTLTIEDLKACEALGDGANVQTTAAAALKRNLQKVNLIHVRALFSNRRLGFSTAMIMIIWGFIGLGEYSASRKLLLYPFRERYLAVC